jgi:hypothetical protein
MLVFRASADEAGILGLPLAASRLELLQLLGPFSPRWLGRGNERYEAAQRKFAKLHRPTPGE